MNFVGEVFCRKEPQGIVSCHYALAIPEVAYPCRFDLSPEFLDYRVVIHELALGGYSKGMAQCVAYQSVSAAAYFAVVFFGA